MTQQGLGDVVKGQNISRTTSDSWKWRANKRWSYLNFCNIWFGIFKSYVFFLGGGLHFPENYSSWILHLMLSCFFSISLATFSRNSGGCFSVLSSYLTLLRLWLQLLNSDRAQIKIIRRIQANLVLCRID